VEDDAMVGMVLREMLEGMGYEVCALVATEEEAVSDAARFKPDLLIVDEHLREGSGGAAAQRIVRARPVACIFMSGARGYPNRSATTVLQKPFHFDDLVNAIKQIIGGGAHLPIA
jgi:DNA-binding response OmpR family regulator